jgi:NADPH-dependent 2,4-dienoyl-CoA reductase/sulfur reductase-like enzyme
MAPARLPLLGATAPVVLPGKGRSETVTDRPKVVIVGGGFGGLYAAKTFRGVPVDVTLID